MFFDSLEQLFPDFHSSCSNFGRLCRVDRAAANCLLPAYLAVKSKVEAKKKKKKETREERKDKKKGKLRRRIERNKIESEKRNS